MKLSLIFLTFLTPSLAFSQDSTLGILPLESPEYSQIETFTVGYYVQNEAEAIGKFSTVTMLFADVILDNLKELGEGCADLDCAYDVVDSADLDQIIVIDLRRINKTGTDSTGATTLSGNMILYLISPETEEPEESVEDTTKKTVRDIPVMVKGWASDISKKTRQLLSGETRAPDNRVNHWYRGSATDVPDILRIMVWELLEEQAPEGYFTDSMLALAQGGLVGEALTFIAANGAVLAFGGLVLVGGGYAIASSGSDDKGFKNPPKFPDVP